MSVDSEDDSFTEVGFSEGEESLPTTTKKESAKHTVEDPQCDDAESEVLVHLQLPPHFSSGEESTEKMDMNNKNEDSSSLSLQSEASSFIPIRSFGRLNVGPDGVDSDKEQAPRFHENDAGNKAQNTGELNFAPRAAAKDDSSEISDWSVVHKDKGRTEDQDDASVAASSTISGFDLISINGSSSQTHTISKGCHNPTFSADELLARALQKEEEEQQAIEEATCQQRKRYALSSSRGQKLDTEILSVVEVCRLTQPSFATTERTGFSTLPQASLARLASKFIKCVNRMQHQTKAYASPVTLCYCYTAKDSTTMNSIRQDGFGEGARFGSTPDAAGKAFARYAFGGSKRRRRLETIMEQGGIGSNLAAAIDIQGWIVAIVSGVRSSTVAVSSGSALVYACKESAESLPLVSFDVTMMKQDVIRCLLNGLTTCFHDFSSRNAKPHTASPSWSLAVPESPKRQKVFGENFMNVADKDKTDDEAHALALQASLYEEEEDDEPDKDDGELHGESFVDDCKTDDEAMALALQASLQEEHDDTEGKYDAPMLLDQFATASVPATTDSVALVTRPGGGSIQSAPPSDSLSSSFPSAAGCNGVSYDSVPPPVLTAPSLDINALGAVSEAEALVSDAAFNRLPV